MNKFLNIATLIIVFSLSACSNTPNSVTMNVAQGQCVQISQYRGVTPNFQSLIESNPTTTTPYCLAVTVQNNNTGLNANNVQVTSAGLQVNYLNFSNNTQTTSQLFDPAAARVSIPTNATQSVNNLILFDPYNCVTTSGAQVVVLSMGGGVCTFYLQESGESSPIGVFPYSLTYNYTNGNANYSVTSTFNQRTTLYGGANNGLNSVTANIVNNTLNPFTNKIQWQSVSGAQGTATYGLTRSKYGIVYFATGNTVYQYNGLNITPVGSPLPISPSIVINLTLDANGNLFAGTNGQGLFVNQFASESTWTPLSTTGITNTSNIIGLKSTTNNGNSLLYVIESTNGYYCAYTNNPPSINCSNIPRGNTAFLQNALDVDGAGTLYFGGLSSNLNLYKWVNGSGSITPYSPSIPQRNNGTIGAVLYNPLNIESGIYFSLSANESSESSVYSCSQSSCNPVLSESGNPIGTLPPSATGNVNTLTNDGYGNLYASGNTLYSADWAGNESTFTPYYPISAALLFGNSVTYGGGNWIPIFPANNTSSQEILSTIVATTLTSY